MKSQPDKTDLQISTNLSGSSGEKPMPLMPLKKPDFFVTKTWRHRSQLSSFIPNKKPLPLKTDGRTSTAWISSVGRTTV
jgi:hypothetical protein